MFPALVPVGDKNIVEYHGAETHHDEFPHTTNVQGRIETIGFKTLPPRALFIAERKNILAEDVAKKTKFETLVYGVGRQHHLIVSLEKQNLASLRMRVKLKDRQNNC